MAESTKGATVKGPGTRPKTGTSPTAAGKKQTTKPAPAAELVTSAPETTTKSRFGFFSALVGRKAATSSATAPTTTKGGAATATTSASGAKPQRPANPSMGRFFFGMSLYMVLALAAQFGLTFLFARLPASYSTVPLFTLPLLGGVTPYLLAWMAILVLILYALYKFKVLPRTLGQPREKAAAKVDPKAGKTTPVKAVREPVEGPNDDTYTRVKARIRSERRKARRS